MRSKKIESGAEFEWCSEANDENHYLNMNGSDEESSRNPNFKYGQDMKNFSLAVGMKFNSVQEFRKVLMIIMLQMFINCC